MGDGSAEKVKLVSADGVEFSIDYDAAMLSETLKNSIEDTGAGSLIPVHNVKGGILSMVVEYTQYHVKANTAKDGKPLSEEEVKTWDSNFVNVEQMTLF